MVSRRIYYFQPQTPPQITACNALPSNINRSSQIHSLINAYKLPLISPRIESATRSDLALFHTEEYIDYIQTSTKDDPEFTESDCSWFEQLSDYCGYIGGAAIESARLLATEGDGTVVVNFDGGR